MSQDCEICSGAGTIRLPVRRRVAVRYQDAADLAHTDSMVRSYACPECSRPDTDEKIDIFGSETIVDTADLERYGADVHRNVHASMASSLAHEFLKRGLISFYEEPRGEMRTAIRARMGVVSPKRVSSIEARAIDKMQSFLSGVLDDACDRISIWGSHYSGSDGPIEKGMAMRFVSEAFATALQKVRRDVA